MKSIIIFYISCFIFFSCKSESNEKLIDVPGDEQNDETLSDTAQGMNVVTESDTRFLKERAAAILLEVEVGQLAIQKSNNQSIKKLSRQVIEERLIMLEELKKLSSLKNVTLPAMPANQYASGLEDLQNENTAEFNKKYLSFFIELLDEDTRKFEKAANNANSPEIKVFASKSLPVSRTHLDKARSLNQ